MVTGAIKICGVLSQRIVAVALLAMCAATSYAQELEVIERTPKTGYEVQQELIATIHETQELINALGAFTYVDPSLTKTLNDQLFAVKFMSYSQLQAIAPSTDTLWKIREEMQRLNTLLRDEANIATQQALLDSDFGPGTQLFHECVDGGRYPGLGSSVLAPGPCEQTGLSGVLMSDVKYPLVCPFSTLPGILVLSRIVLQLTRFTADVLDRVCSQALFGANTATACIIARVIEVVALITFDVLDGCNGKRGDAELVIAYSRSGEIYLSNKENFAAQDAAMRSTFDKVIVTNSVLSELVMSEKTATLSELEQGFSGTTQRLIELETQAIENSQRLARVLDEQRTIMRELGIEHLYKDPNTPTSGFVPLGFLLIDAAPAKKSQPRDNIFIDPGSEDRR